MLRRLDGRVRGTTRLVWVVQQLVDNMDMMLRVVIAPSVGDEVVQASAED